MAQGTILSDKSRDGIAALVWRNMGDLEENMWELQYEWDQREATFDGMQAAMEQAGLRVLNTPNLLKQNWVTTRNMPTSTVISQDLTVPVEDATAAAAALTFTVTNEAITSSHVLHGVKSSNYDVVSYGSVSCSAGSGSATITIAARSGAHDAAVTVTVYLCTVASTEVVYGDYSRIYVSSYPYLKEANGHHGDYPGDDTDEIQKTVVTLTGANIVTESNGETFNKAIQFTVANPPTNGWGNSDSLIFNYGYGTNDLQGLPEMISGETYTMSCWVRITSGTKQRLSFKWGVNKNDYANGPRKPELGEQTDKYIEVEAKNGQWQRISWTFTYLSSQTFTETYYRTENEQLVPFTVTYNETYQPRVSFGCCRWAAATIQVCGFRLTRGKLYICETYDDLEEDLFTQKGRIATLESKSTSILADIADSETATATAAHAVGDLITVGNQLYKVTAAIAIGDTITATGNSANVTATTLEALIAEKASATALSTEKSNILANIAGSDTATATAAHAVGDVILVGGQLYSVTAAIAIGDTITDTGAGANVESTTVAALIAPLLALTSATGVSF